MLYLLLAILSSSAVAVVMRLSSERVRSSMGMLLINYVTCVVTAAAYADFRLFPTAQPGLSTAVLIGISNGVLYLASFILLQKNTKSNGIVLSSIFMKLGLLVPITVSLLIFGEVPTVLQTVGFLLAVFAIVLINFEKNSGRAGGMLSLLALLLCGGGGDAMAKIFEVLGNGDLSDQFLFYTFTASLAVCFVLMLRQKERIGREEVLFGVLLGLPNFFSAKFLLRSLSYLPAFITYPSFSVGTILLVTLLGVLFFSERLRKRQWLALGIILVALVMLNV